eukprot:TRINITY_DN20607_c0_g1_i1.p1 TRINITY_DN20607_c0_g1~~TRINITY_DN20607_c0_g1_i1.p1  ORF type:complete len:273 (+),score=93.75 TRINITY_DN20607_c0_g1_i1:43-861(+)
MDLNTLFGVKGKNVLVSGGGRGIGLYIAQGFVVNGANVYITSRSTEDCKKAAAELSSLGGGKCIALEGVDLSNREACYKAADNLKKHITELHVLVNNSGTSWGGAYEEYAEKGWDKVMNVNVKAMFYLTQALTPLLEAASSIDDPARIINIGSIAGVFPQAVPTYAYDLSKAAVHHLTVKLAAELGRRKITVNAIAPGFVPSKMSNQLLTYDSAENFAAKTAIGRIGSPSDMAAACLYLASKGGSWVTGAVIVIDGGQLSTPAFIPFSPSKL